MAESRRHRPGITLMDLRLPGTNGTDALIAIRELKPRGRRFFTSDCWSRQSYTIDTESQGALATCASSRLT
ncbi:MAG TPA: hypothetical protein VEV41_01290, partial [Terriglobales bacterium]|nr:hypothetical protein [Terriglobales bacterium]